MPVKAVVDNIDFATVEPFEERLLRPGESCMPWFEPVQLLCHIVPKLVPMS